MELRIIDVMLLLLLSPHPVHPGPMLSWMKTSASLARPVPVAEKAGSASPLVSWTKAVKDTGTSSKSFLGKLGKKALPKKTENWTPGDPNDILFSVPASYRRKKAIFQPLSSIPEHSVIKPSKTEFKQAFPTKTEKLEAQLGIVGLAPTKLNLLQRFQRFYKQPQAPTSLARSSQASSLQRFEHSENKFLGLAYPKSMEDIKRVLARLRAGLARLTTRFAKRLEQVGKSLNQRTGRRWRQVSKFFFPNAQATKNV